LCKFKKTFLNVPLRTSNSNKSRLVDHSKSEESRSLVGRQNYHSQNKDTNLINKEILGNNTNQKMFSNAKSKPRSRVRSMISRLDRSDMTDYSPGIESQKDFLGKQLYTESKELERIFMKIKRSTTHYEDWQQKDKYLKTQMELKRQKIHNDTIEDFDRKNVIESMSTTSNALNKHIDDRF